MKRFLKCNIEHRLKSPCGNTRRSRIIHVCISNNEKSSLELFNTFLFHATSGAWLGRAIQPFQKVIFKLFFFSLSLSLRFLSFVCYSKWNRNGERFEILCEYRPETQNSFLGVKREKQKWFHFWVQGLKSFTRDSRNLFRASRPAFPETSAIEYQRGDIVLKTKPVGAHIDLCRY